jgi:hypothetical protein
MRRKGCGGRVWGGDEQEDGKKVACAERVKRAARNREHVISRGI